MHDDGGVVAGDGVVILLSAFLVADGALADADADLLSCKVGGSANEFGVRAEGLGGAATPLWS